MTFARVIRVAMAALPVLVALSGCGGSQARYQSHLDRGRHYLAAGELEKASIEFRNALQIEPRSYEAFYLTGRVAERQGNIAEALGYYQAAVDVDPKETRARASLAKVFVLGGATERAIQEVAPGLLEHPDDPDLLAARAAARHQLGDEYEARVDAERAVKLAPTNENAISVLSALALRAGDSARAVALVTGAVEKSPDSVDLRRILSSVYLAAGEPRLAEEQMDKIIALEPSQMAPRMQLANHFVQTKQLDAAQKVLEDAVRDMPQRIGAKLALVDFITSQRSRAAGERVLRRYLAEDADNEDLRLGLGTLLERDGAIEDALATFREVVRREGIRSRGLAARDRIAAIELSRGHEAAARQLLEEVLAESPRDDDALIMRANIAMMHNDATSAVADFRAVLRDQPKSVVLQRSLARAYLLKGQPALAEESLRSALELMPDEVAIRVDLAQVLIQTDRAASAVSMLEETVHSAPGDVTAREALVRAYIANHELVAARQAAEDLKTLRPDAAEGYYLAGLIAHDENRADECEKNFQRALELEPGSIDILTALTRFDLERGRQGAAVERLQRVLDREPRNVQVLDLSGATYLEIHDLGRAAEVLTRAAALAPGSWVAYRDLGQVRLSSGDVNGAVREYETALKLAPTQARVVTELASIYEKVGRIDAAVACYEALYQRNTADRSLAANNLAMLLVTYKADRPSLDRARALTAAFDGSTNPSFLDTAGWVRFKRHEYREAVALLGRAMDHSPDSKVIRYHLGMAQLRAGQREEARTNLEAALAGEANFSGSQEARSALASLRAPRSG